MWERIFKLNFVYRQCFNLSVYEFNVKNVLYNRDTLFENTLPNE